MSLIDRLLHNARPDDGPESDGGQVENKKPATVSRRAIGHGPEDDMQAMLRDFEDIQDIIGDEEPTGTAGEKTAISMTVSEVLAALPADCLSGTEPAAPNATIDVTVRDPYDQLKRGKVEVEVADLIRGVPNDLLRDEVGNHLSDLVTVPLAKVVAGMSPEEFAKRTATEEREPAIHSMPNLFDREDSEGGQAVEPTPAPIEETRPEPKAEQPAPAAPGPAEAEQAELPEVEKAPPGPIEPIAAETELFEPAVYSQAPPEATEEAETETPTAEVTEPLPEPEPPAPAPESPARVESPPEAEPPTVSAAAPTAPEIQPTAAAHPVPVPEPETPSAPPSPLYVAGLDINSADASELVDAFEGVGPKLAQRIVAARPYSTQRELGKVPGLGRALYHRMTGDSLPRGRVAMEEISEILGDPAHGMPKFKAVAQAVAELPGVSGCVLSHTDGYLLAQAWKRGKGQSIGAIAPQLFKQVGKYFELLQMEGPDSMTLFVEPRPVFITRSGDVFMIVFVSRSRLSARRVTFLEVLASELTGRLKHGAAQ